MLFVISQIRFSNSTTNVTKTYNNLNYLKIKDISKNLEGSLVSVYWEEGFNMWFDGVIESINIINGTISIYYPHSDESERNTNLRDLIEHQWIKRRKPNIHEKTSEKTFIDPKLNSKLRVNQNLSVENDDAPLLDRLKHITTRKKKNKLFDKSNLEESFKYKSREKIESFDCKTRKSRGLTKANINLHHSQKLTKSIPIGTEKDQRFRNLICDDIKKYLDKANCELREKCENVFTYSKVADMAKNIENAIWTACDFIVSENYKYKYRLFISNMNDPGNSEFKKSVCQGELTPTQIMSLSETELMSSAKRAEMEALKIKVNEARVIDIEQAALMNTTAAEIYAEEIREKTQEKTEKRSNNNFINNHAGKTKISDKCNSKTEYDSIMPSCWNNTWDVTEWSGTLSISSASSESIYLLSVRIRVICGRCPIHLILPKHHIMFKMSMWLDQFTSYLANLTSITKKRTISLAIVQTQNNDELSLIEFKNLFYSYLSSQMIGSADRIDHEKRFDFHLLPSQLNLTNHLLESARKISSDIIKAIPKQIGPFDLLLVVIHPTE